MSDEKLTVKEFGQKCHTLIQSLINRVVIMNAVKLHDREFIIVPNLEYSPYPISIKLDQTGQVSYGFVGHIAGDIIQCDNCL